MFFRVMLFVWQFVLDLVAVMRMTDDEKDLEIMLLRQQLRVVERKQERGPQLPRWEKVPPAALAVRMKNKASNAREALAESVRLFKPDTLGGWHRAIVRRKWTFKQGRKPGHPPIDSELEGWILQVARDNPMLGYDKLNVRVYENEQPQMSKSLGAGEVHVSRWRLATCLQRLEQYTRRRPPNSDGAGNSVSHTAQYLTRRRCSLLGGCHFHCYLP
jgi:hypothetical protein